ncbi:substrate-binding domain-containing protein [Coraliomargarita parva]|uniref:substrate-binding domain-containing protein n=1 Tax=Coraliomargarita parva TaxID=3014050 RepID=UPI0022B3F255|nr:substrate-binding domain-containing protein [Coraliomargarita parva]
MSSCPEKASQTNTLAQSAAPRVVVYSGADARKQQSSLFYLHLFWAIMERGRQLGFEMVPLMDTRPEKNRYGAPPENAQVQKGGAVDGYIAIMAYESMVEWIRDSGVPMTILHGSSVDVVFDSRGMIEKAVRRLAELGCRSVGLMIPSEPANSKVLEMLDDLSAEIGININYEWIIVSREAMETKGYHQFESLWDLKSRPDGLFIYPDVTARGVVSAIVERHVRVPEDLKLILHRNVESPYLVPFPCDWMEVSVNPIADALLQALQVKLRGETPERQLIEFHLVKGEGAREF